MGIEPTLRVSARKTRGCRPLTLPVSHPVFGPWFSVEEVGALGFGRRGAPTFLFTPLAARLAIR